MKFNVNNQYSLYNIENFKNKIENNIFDIQDRYIKLIIEYLNYIFDNIKINKNTDYTKFIIIRGFETISHVFNILLYYTKNLDITYYHSQKSFYYYVEFIDQVTEAQNIFLQLNSRDATIYVYKKTIFEINNEYRKNVNNVTIDEDSSKKIIIFEEYQNFYKNIIYNILNQKDFIQLDKKNIHEIILQIETIFHSISTSIELKDLYKIEEMTNAINIDSTMLTEKMKNIQISIQKIKSKKM